jgi:hypothetical protein
MESTGTYSLVDIAPGGEWCDLGDFSQYQGGAVDVQVSWTGMSTFDATVVLGTRHTELGGWVRNEYLSRDIDSVEWAQGLIISKFTSKFLAIFINPGTDSGTIVVSAMGVKEASDG